MTDTEFMEAVLVLTAFVLLAVLAPLYGADSRHLNDGFRD
jgi:hypothetical protein